MHVQVLLTMTAGETECIKVYNNGVFLLLDTSWALNITTEHTRGIVFLKWLDQLILSLSRKTETAQ